MSHKFVHEPQFCKRSIETYPERQEVQHVYDYRGSQGISDRPRVLECDFCGRASDRLWFWPVYAFGVEYDRGVRMIQPDPSTWGACVFCRPLFEYQDFDALAARASTLVGSQMPHEAYKHIHQSVHSAISGPMFTWESGQLRPKTT